MIRGNTVKTWLSNSKIRERVRLVTLEGFKDPSDLHVADPERFKERFEEALDALEPILITLQPGRL